MAKFDKLSKEDFIKIVRENKTTILAFGKTLVDVATSLERAQDYSPTTLADIRKLIAGEDTLFDVLDSTRRAMRDRELTEAHSRISELEKDIDVDDVPRRPRAQAVSQGEWEKRYEDWKSTGATKSAYALAIGVSQSQVSKKFKEIENAKEAETSDNEQG